MTTEAFMQSLHDWAERLDYDERMTAANLILVSWSLEANLLPDEIRRVRETALAILIHPQFAAMD